ncbi:EthD family reductase [Kineosporia sp. A_224]|uniref:EthD family reductase n=1 Tax=Kineosporia sp. A_224 TaxID=1962180 RepID=UPI000B4B021D|nr:EthD family reductase [Kineosporia sp. A_224]
MPTKITFIDDNPADADAFERGYAAGHLDLVRALPGVVRVEASKARPTEDGSPTPAYRMVDAWFDDYDRAVAAVQGPAAGALFPAVFGLATGGVRIVFSDVEVGE